MPANSVISLSESLITPCRKITGISAVLLPFKDDKGTVDWEGFEKHAVRVFDAGLFPAVNMDTGFANLIGQDLRDEVLKRTQQIADGRFFVAGAFVGDKPGENFNLDAYQRATTDIAHHGGVPVLFQSYGLTEQNDEAIVDSYQRIAAATDQFIAFELGAMFAPFGKIYSLNVYEELVKIQSCTGAKHSSLERQDEWERLELRNRIRPEFKVYTGNDLAIDMVRYGSDYLLGLSTFAPDLFALRDRYWEQGNDRFYQLNDLLQYLGAFGFRDPTPAYKHTAAMFLKLQGMIDCDATHPQSPTRPDSDREVLASILDSLIRYRDN
jgi:dihydrodipicolinate synthase/N-acetylneuraminate lyase